MVTIFISSKETLHHEYRIEVPIKCLEGRLYCRVSGHIYNDVQDYERLATVVASMM